MNTETLAYASKEGSSSNLDPFFVIGSGRSGTTLIRGILNANKEVHIPHESTFLARAYRFYQYKHIYSSKDYLILSKLFALTSQINGWGMNTDDIYNSLCSTRPQSFSDVNNSIYNLYLSQNGFEYSQWGIKAPSLIAAVDKITSVFPNAKFVHMLRDGRDVYLSYRQIHESGKEPFGPRTVLQASLYWTDGMRRIGNIPVSKLIEIRYEDLVSNPEHEVTRLCKFLNISYDSEMWENYHRSSRNEDLVLAKHQQSIHSKVQGGIDPAGVAKYRELMSERERYLFELISQPYLKKYGYPCDFDNLDHLLQITFRSVLHRSARIYNNARYNVRDFERYYRSYASARRYLDNSYA